MKKSLLALAVLGAFTGVASAQSSLTIYGFVNQAYGHKAGTGINTWADSGAGSRLGFKGTEDLGGGLKAEFQIEHRFNPDEGTTASTNLWHGQSRVALSHSKYGSVSIGRQYTATFSLIQNAGIDPFAGDGYAELRSVYMIADKTLTGTTDAGLAAVRFNNSVRYDYSKSGLNFAFSIGERAINADGQSFNSSKGDKRPMAAAVNYTMGGLFVGAGVENPQGNGDYLVNLGARYNFGFLVGSLGYSTGTTTSGKDASSVLAGVRVPMGKAAVKAGYATSKIDGAESIFKVSLGVDYGLSARTKLFADVGHYGGDAVEGMDNKNAYMIGVQHNF